CVFRYACAGVWDSACLQQHRVSGTRDGRARWRCRADAKRLPPECLRPRAFDSFPVGNGGTSRERRSTVWRRERSGFVRPGWIGPGKEPLLGASIMEEVVVVRGNGREDY